MASPFRLALRLLHLGDSFDLRGRTVCATGIEVSTKNGDAMVTKNLERLKGTLPT